MPSCGRRFLRSASPAHNQAHGRRYTRLPAVLNRSIFHLPCLPDTEMRPTDAGDGHPECTSKDPRGPMLEKKVKIKVALPTFPTKIDFGLLIDVSGSYR